MKIRKITKIDRMKRNIKKMSNKNLMIEVATEIIDIGEKGVKKIKKIMKK